MDPTRVERVEVIEIKPGDMLVGYYPRTASQEDIDNFVATLRQLSKGGPIGVAQAGYKIDVIRPTPREGE